MGNLDRLPFSIRVLLENALRWCGQGVVTEDARRSAGRAGPRTAAERPEIPFMPARVVLQDFTGVPCVVDLAAMRDAMAEMGGDPDRINPVVPCDLVIDHSVQVDHYGTPSAPSSSTWRWSSSRNAERYQLLKFAQRAFHNFRVVPPGHRHRAPGEPGVPRARWSSCASSTASLTAYPDTLVGTDSHTTMINGLGVVGWGVGGIEAEAVMLGQPYFMLVPDVIGMKLTGALPLGTTATDLVLHGDPDAPARRAWWTSSWSSTAPASRALGLADRATIANMAPGVRRHDGLLPGGRRDAALPASAPAASRRRSSGSSATARSRGSSAPTPRPTPSSPARSSSTSRRIEPSLAGPKRPQDLVPLRHAQAELRREPARPDAARPCRRRGGSWRRRLLAAGWARAATTGSAGTAPAWPRPPTRRRVPSINGEEHRRCTTARS